MFKTLKHLIFFTILAGLSISEIAYASPIFVIERKDGSITFTNKKPRFEKYSIFSSTAARFSFSHKSPKLRTQISEKFHKIIEYESKRAGVDTSLVKAVIHVESGFNPRALSHKGAMGLMQLMPGTAKMMGVKDPYLPEQNIQGGIKFLSILLEKYSGNLGLTLAAYNAGEFTIEKYGGIPPYNETISYVKKVMKLRDAYKVARG
ncbi:MAG: lytic transglycosylase domain-containing protein [bacterium]|nr:lytic transglycosylase domain-containing protein [bacterium]